MDDRYKVTADRPLDEPWTDETGDVDLSLIYHALTLTPAERLRRAEGFAEFIFDAWRARGIPWADGGG